MAGGGDRKPSESRALTVPQHLIGALAEGTRDVSLAV